MGIRSVSVKVEPGYESLLTVLVEALNDAQYGKGKERHADNKPFIEQDICQLGREEGLGFPRGQARKKLKESRRLTGEHRIKEELGAINFICADIILYREEMDKNQEVVKS